MQDDRKTSLQHASTLNLTVDQLKGVVDVTIKAALQTKVQNANTMDLMKGEEDMMLPPLKKHPSLIEHMTPVQFEEQGSRVLLHLRFLLGSLSLRRTASKASTVAETDRQLIDNFGAEMTILPLLLSWWVLQGSHKCVKWSHNAVLMDEFTLVGLAIACASLGTLELLRKVHGVALSTGLDFNVVVCNALIDAYRKCGVLQSSHNTFSRMEEKDVS
ncbi:hypothetical protein BUALT_Bualt04G0057300 [Buddleja alternifolia]|uniref:Uncharacterized protein n=1 Tax=Buddleja alternifolia TaxID=168488 RepID=A0AAV6XUR1_9LAMI|nr:hypothetical protein BUALT_Bualt04G0057300 [Buddleja alternifolia]